MTTLYVLMKASNYAPQKSFWIKNDAVQALEALSRDNAKYYVEEIETPDIADIVMDYFGNRGLTMGNKDDALHFLTSETGELCDAFVQSKRTDWVRNNEKERDPEKEAGDVLMMLTVFAMLSGFDPLQAIVDKFRSKGYDKDTFQST